MRNLKWTVGVAAICASAVLFAMPATAATAKLSDCLHSASQVREAIAKNQDSPTLGDAQRQQRYGLEFCNGGFYGKGTAHYAEALKLLGAGDTSWGEASARP